MYEKVAKDKFNKLHEEYDRRDILILSIESSCDETSIAVLKNGREILSNVISSQIDIHKKFGGVVPEIASRNHLMAISGVLQEALTLAKVKLTDIDAIAVTYGAGLLGALLVGVSFAKALAYALEIPLIRVNHILGHMSANYISHTDLKSPYICAIISGGHTALLKVKDLDRFELLGTTTDDAIGEAYDKVAKVLGLPYPGGPIVDANAKLGERNIIFVKKSALRNSFNFSFSGLKTAVINYIHKMKQKGQEISVYDVCASFQYEAMEELMTKAIRACKKYNIDKLSLAGGVSANSYLRSELSKRCEQEKIKLYYPPLVLCTDNAAMIGAEAYNSIITGKNLSGLDLSVDSGMHLKNTNRN